MPSRRLLWDSWVNELNREGAEVGGVPDRHFATKIAITLATARMVGNPCLIGSPKHYSTRSLLTEHESSANEKLTMYPDELRFARRPEERFQGYSLTAYVLPFESS